MKHLTFYLPATSYLAAKAPACFAQVRDFTTFFAK